MCIRDSLGTGRDRGKVFRQHVLIAFGPDQNGAAGAQIGHVDPRRAAGQAVDQYARLRMLVGVMRDITACLLYTSARARIAMSWIFMIFCACVSDSAPPNTVKSLAKTKICLLYTSRCV